MPTYTTSTGLFLFSGKVPDRAMSERVVRGHVLRALQLFGDEIKRDFEETVATWRDPAIFDKPVVRYSGGYARMSITTESDKWRWLNEGTSVRWAIMQDGGTPNKFYPKTAPGQWKAGPGGGNPEPVWRGYSMGFPQDGIIARDWTGQAKLRYRDKMREELRDAIRRGVQSSRGRP